MTLPGVKSIQVRLNVSDLRASAEFYTTLLGFRVAGSWPDDKPTFAILENGEVGVQIGESKERGVCTLWMDVHNVLRFHEAIKDKVPIEFGPEVYFYGRREFAFRDPDGHMVILSEETADPVTSPQD